MTPPDPPPADDGFADSPVSVCVPESCELDKSSASDDTPTDSDESIAPVIETPTGPAVAGSLTVLSVHYRSHKYVLESNHDDKPRMAHGNVRIPPSKS